MSAPIAHSVDWHHDGSSLQALAAGDLRAAALLPALARSFANDMAQPVGRLPWDAVDANGARPDSFDGEEEGSGLFDLLDGDLGEPFLRAARRAAERLAAGPRYADWVEAVTLVDAQADGEAVTLSYELSAGDETAVAVARIGG